MKRVWQFIRHTRWWQRLIAAAVVLVLIVGWSSGAFASLFGGAGGSNQNSAVELDKGLVSWWKFDGNSKDSTPYAKNGTDHSTGLVADRLSQANKAYDFDGTTGWSDFPQPGIGTGPNLFTIAGWIKPGDQAGFFLTPNSNGIDQHLNYDNVNHRIVVAITEIADVNNRARVSTTNSVPVGSWTHFAVVINNLNIKIYINGQLNAQYNETINIGDWAGNWRVGQRGNNTFWYLGAMDDFRVYNRELSAAEVVALAQSSGSGLQVSDTQKGLLGWWKMDGNAKDATPNADDGTVTNASLTADRKGAGNSAYSFDGASTVISMGTPSVFTNFSAMTWMAWIKPTSVGTDQMFLSKQGANYFRINGGKLFSSMSIAGLQKTKAANTVMSNGTWYHAAVTYDGSAMTIYLNGQQDGQLTGLSGSALFSSGAFEIGRWTAADPRWYFGSIDDVRVYNRALSQAEIQQLKDSYEARPIASSLTSGLVGSWQFNGNAKDATPYGDNGTVSGATLTADRKGNSNSAYTFTASGNKITLASPVGQSGQMTASVWYKRDDANASSTWRDILAHASANIHPLIVHTTTRNLGIWDGTFRDSGYNVPNDGKWHNFVVVYNSTAGNASFYVDGSFINTVTTTLNLGTNPIGTIGNWSGGNYWAGPIDDVRFWNRALSATEVSQLYDETR